MTRMPTPRATPSPPPDIPGLAARGIAADILEGVLRRHQRRADGSFRDTVVYSVLREEWPEVRAGLEARLA